MTWEDHLRASARDLGRGLERAHPNPPARRRIRVLPIAVAVLAVAAVFAFRPRDPAAAIESAYSFKDVRIDDPELRREFEAALAHVDRAIALAKDAVRRSRGDPAFAELCHLAFQAKVRLIQAYSGRS